MTVCKENILEFLKEDTLSSWAKFLKIDIRVIEKLINGTGTIHIKTAQKIVDRINKQTGDKFELDTFFNLDELKGYEKEREVVYEASGNPLSKEEWISVVRYVIEKRWDAFSILDVFIFTLIVSIITLLILYFI